MEDGMLEAGWLWLEGEERGGRGGWVGGTGLTSVVLDPHVQVRGGVFVVDVD